MKLKMIELFILVCTLLCINIQAEQKATLNIKNESGEKVAVSVYGDIERLAPCSENQFLLENNQSKTITCDYYKIIQANGAKAYSGGATSQSYDHSSESRNFTINYLSIMPRPNSISSP